MEGANDTLTCLDPYFHLYDAHWRHGCASVNAVRGRITGYCPVTSDIFGSDGHECCNFVLSAPRLQVRE